MNRPAELYEQFVRLGEPEECKLNAWNGGNVIVILLVRTQATKYSDISHLKPTLSGMLAGDILTRKGLGRKG